MNLLNDLQWRYAAKQMNGQIVPREKIDYILEAARLAPSSAGLQPFEIIVISGKEALQQVIPAATGNNQALIAKASNLLVFAAWDNYTTERINDVFDFTTSERGLPAGALDAFKQRMGGMFSQKSMEENFTHTTKQAYISLGIALAAAAEQKVDATPMEGFNAVALDKILNLKEKGLRSVVIMALGYRDEAADQMAKMKKVRTPRNKFFTEIA